MLKHMDRATAERCLTEAAESPLSRDGVKYPDWYLHRWHFLPEGYLSRRSTAMYEFCIRRVYYLGAENHALNAIRSALRFQAPERVLEMGCGPGRALETIAHALPDTRVTGIDLSPFQLERARRRCLQFGDRVQVLHGDATALPHKEASFDAVVAAHVAGHLPEAESAALVGEAHRLLKPGGRLYLVEHSWHSLPTSALRLMWAQHLHGKVSKLLCFERREPSGTDSDDAPDNRVFVP